MKAKGTIMNFYEAVNREIDPNYKTISFDDLRIRPIFLYGSGKTGVLSAQSLFISGLRRSLHFIGFADSTSEGEMTFTIRNGEKITKPIFTIDAIQEDYPDAVIVLAMGKEAKAQVLQKLRNYKFGVIMPSLGALISLIQNPSVNSFAPHYCKYEEVYNSFNDHISQSLIAKIAAARMGYCPPPENYSVQQYFPLNLFSLSENEVFVDCGAFDGNDSINFTKFTNNKYTRIVMFEPNKENFGNIQKRVPYLSDSRITVENYGVWSTKTTLKFQNDSASSTIISDNDNSDENVDVISLDEYFKDKPATEQPTFIKMDIEGAEIEALKGSQNIIREFTPKLAICVYHKIADMYEIPELIRSINPNYKMSLLHHSDSFYETVLYCY
jgi:FkbM family methyltransferase